MMYIVASHERYWRPRVELVEKRDLARFLATVDAKKDSFWSLSEGTDAYESPTGRTYMVRRYNGGELTIENFHRCKPVGHWNFLSESEKLELLTSLLKIKIQESSH